MFKNLSLVVILLILGCKQQEIHQNKSTNFNLSGTISGGYSDYIFLGYGKVKDSTKVIDGKFKFKGELDIPTRQAWLNLRPPSNIGWLYLENNAIKITSEYSQTENDRGKLNLIDITKIDGSKTSEIQKKYYSFFKENKLKENFNTLLYKEVETILIENPKNSLSGKILGGLSSSSQLKINELEYLYTIIDTT
jgi:hypothetical protein